jgi:hypothetical protein
MAMVCPQCLRTFDQRLHCPTCGARLVYQGQHANGDGSAGTNAWQQTPWGRILIGLIVAQGLCFGLQQLWTAGLLAGGDETAADVWRTLYGLLVLQGLQVVGLLVGGALAGAGKTRGVLFGALVGFWNGLLFILLQSHNSQLFTPVTLYGQPILQTAFGGLGGFIGCLIWKPPAPLYLPGAGTGLPSVSAASSRESTLFAGPVYWWRVLPGIALAVGGSLWANVILDLVIEASEGKMSVRTHLQANLVTWEITALAMLAGAGLAGATTRNGVKQGLCVGLGVAAVLVGVRLGYANANFDSLLLTAGMALAFGLGGGWFGGTLFPPVVARPKRLGPAI